MLTPSSVGLQGVNFSNLKFEYLKELNDSYYMSLFSAPAIEHGSGSDTLQLDGKRMVVIGSSHAGKLSALLGASMATQFLKLPPQSQTRMTTQRNWLML